MHRPSPAPPKNYAARGSGLARLARGFEYLEIRLALSADAVEMLPLGEVFPQVTNRTPSGFNPAQIRHAYGFDQISFAGGQPADGSNQTIAIVDAYNDPKVVADLQVFDQKFNLAAPPSIKVVNQTGGSTLPKNNASWSQEIALDVEWAHAIAPGASILLVEAKSANTNDLLAAVNYAKAQPQVSVVSMSWGSPEFAGQTSLDATFTPLPGHPVTFVAASGDNGSPAIWPAISSNVLAVGGTLLKTSDSAGSYGSESGWSGSGGGLSLFESKPAFQNNAVAGIARANPDVAYDAAPGSGFAVYDSVSYLFQSGWLKVGGTSAGAPQWSALLAIANQGRVLAGNAPLSSGQAAVYSLPAGDFNDITSGSNGGYTAAAGYDLVTGLGTPRAAAVIADLAGAATVGTAATPRAAGSVAHLGHVGLRLVQVDDSQPSVPAAELATRIAAGGAAGSLSATALASAPAAPSAVVTTLAVAVIVANPLRPAVATDAYYHDTSSELRGAERIALPTAASLAADLALALPQQVGHSTATVHRTTQSVESNTAAAKVRNAVVERYFAAEATADRVAADPPAAVRDATDPSAGEESTAWFDAAIGMGVALALLQVLPAAAEQEEPRSRCNGEVLSRRS